MISKIPVRLMIAVTAVAAIAACKPSTTVGSPGTTAAPAANRAPAVPAGVTPATIAEGKTLVELPANNCTRCHGAEVKGGQRAPSLVDTTWSVIDGSYSEIGRIINEGVPAGKLTAGYTTPMPPKGRATLTDAQVNAIAAYLWSVSHPR